MTLCRGFGCQFDGDMPIVGALPMAAPLAPSASRVIHVRTHMQETRPDHQPAGERMPIWQTANGLLTFRPPAAGTFVIGRDRVDHHGSAADDPPYVSGLLIATALPALMWLRGAFMLHAAGVVLPGSQRMTALMANSGVGKSTVAAAMLRQGASLVGDDSLALIERNGEVTGSGLAGGLFLENSGERQFLPSNAAFGGDSAALGSMILLQRTEGAATIERVNGVEAIAAVLDNQHRPSVPAILGKRAQVLEFVAFLVKSVPLYCCRFDPGHPSGTADQLACMLAGHRFEEV